MSFVDKNKLIELFEKLQKKDVQDLDDLKKISNEWKKIKKRSHKKYFLFSSIFSPISLKSKYLISYNYLIEYLFSNLIIKNPSILKINNFFGISDSKNYITNDDEIVRAFKGSFQVDIMDCFKTLTEFENKLKKMKCIRNNNVNTHPFNDNMVRKKLKKELKLIKDLINDLNKIDVKFNLDYFNDDLYYFNIISEKRNIFNLPNKENNKFKNFLNKKLEKPKECICSYFFDCIFTMINNDDINDKNYAIDLILKFFNEKNIRNFFIFFDEKMEISTDIIETNEYYRKSKDEITSKIENKVDFNKSYWIIKIFDEIIQQIDTNKYTENNELTKLKKYIALSLSEQWDKMLKLQKQYPIFKVMDFIFKIDLVRFVVKNFDNLESILDKLKEYNEKQKNKSSSINKAISYIKKSIDNKNNNKF